MIIKKNTGGGGNFTPISEDLHEAVCIAVIGIGEQYNKFNDNMQQKLMITWEIPKERREWETKDGVKHEGPGVISKNYTVSLDDRSNLYKDLIAWRGRDFTIEELEGFDLSNILGKSCKIMVTHTTKGDKTYANVANIMAFKGTPLTPEQPLVNYDANDHNEEEFAKLKEWQQKLVVLPNGKHPYMEGKPEEVKTEDVKDDDLPF